MSILNYRPDADKRKNIICRVSTRILACNSHRPKKRCVLLNVYADYSNMTFWRLNVLFYPLTSHS